MARGFPSMTALLGILAIAGYQNREKLAEMLGNHNTASGEAGLGGTTGSGQSNGLSGLGGLLGRLSDNTTGGGLAGILGGGLKELNDRFHQSGQGDAVDSWVGTGTNRDVAPKDLEQAIGPEVLSDLAEQTGLSRKEILARLSHELPEAVDQYTPQGRLPEEDDLRG